MSSQDFHLNGATLSALPCGALWWQDRSLLCISDLHLGKSERIARLGGTLLPPYDTAETLMRLRHRIEDLNPEIVVSLGDSFDDQNAEFGLMVSETRMLAAMMAGRRWVWIAGNHDPGPVETGGTWVHEFALGPLTFRHIAEPGTPKGEISGHYHPVKRVSTRGRSVTRACFLVDETRAILPAYGAFTGGLHCDHPAFTDLMRPTAMALLTGQKILSVPAEVPAAPAAPVKAQIPAQNIDPLRVALSKTH